MNLHERTPVGVENNALTRFDAPIPQRWERILSSQTPDVSSYEEVLALSTPDYLRHINDLARDVVTSPDYHDPETGYISQTAWKRLVDGGLLASSLDERDGVERQTEIMWVGRMLSYYDISLGLTYGITTALAIMPIQRFGSPEQQKKYLGRIRNGDRFGLAITERDKSGSTALIMDSKYEINDDGTTYLEFLKKWQGLSDMDGLFVAAIKSGMPEDKPTVGFFIVDQDYMQTELIKMNVLSGVSYGINTGKLTLNTHDNLMTELTFPKGLLVFQDLFTKSRLLFVGMTLGHQEMTEYEAQTYANGRAIGREILAEMEIPEQILSDIRARSAILDAIFSRTAEYRKNGTSLLEANTILSAMEPKIIKVLSAEYAHASAKDRVKIEGANSFLANSAQQDADDIEPFRTFEGAEDMLYQQIGRDIIRSSGTTSDMWTNHNFNLEFYETLRGILKQEKMSKMHEKLLGQIFSRLFALGCLDQNLIDQKDFIHARTMLNGEIQELALRFSRVPMPIKP